MMNEGRKEVRKEGRKSFGFRRKEAREGRAGEKRS
jgi:hypothetical protein